MPPKRFSFLFILARFILQGLEKWQKILDKATPERPIGKVRQFSTRGDYNKAVADFESLNPLDVTEFIIPAVVCIWRS